MLATATEREPATTRSAGRITGSESRIHHRRGIAVDLYLTDLRGETVLRCRCNNISAGGLFAVAPVGYGLAVGQRYELRARPIDGRADLLLGDSLGYGTIIRTQFAPADAADGVGVAVRFDVPQYLSV